MCGGDWKDRSPTSPWRQPGQASLLLVTVKRFGADQKAGFPQRTMSLASTRNNALVGVATSLLQGSGEVARVRDEASSGGSDTSPNLGGCPVCRCEKMAEEEKVVKGVDTVVVVAVGGGNSWALWASSSVLRQGIRQNSSRECVVLGETLHTGQRLRGIRS